MTRIQLDRCLGPECPNCGCRDAELLREPINGAGEKSWFGSGLAECNHCGRRFHFKELPAQPAPLEETPPEEPQRELAAAEPDPPRIKRAIIPVVTCQDCDTKMKITTVKKHVRYHKCPKCGNTAKTARQETRAES